MLSALFSLALGATLAAPTVASAAIATFGSSFPAPASLNTSENLNYQGIDTPLPGYVFHTPHYGADTALWNTSVAGGHASAPEAGQVVKVSLEGCAQRAQNGPSPLNQIHFQILSPQPDGGAKVELSSQPFEIPVCGQSGASGSTVSSYVPINLCVNAGDYVAFNDEGGYVENVYRSGVPYQVMTSTAGSTMDSFIKGGGTGNGASLSPSVTSPGDGFAVNLGEELMMQATLGTGPDARYVCSGGTKEAPPVLKPVKVRPQTEGVDRNHTTAVSMYCTLKARCEGTATLTSTNGHVKYGSTHFGVPGRTTSHVPIPLNHNALVDLRRHHRSLITTVTVVISGQVEQQLVRLMSP